MLNKHQNDATMTTIIMTTPKLTGGISFTYNDAGLLTELTINDTLTDAQYAILGNNLPYKKEMLPAFKERVKEATFVTKKVAITFDMFWERYNDKVRSSKKKTQLVWDKMKEADQIKAYYFYPTYDKNRGNADKKYATTYLSDQLWNN